MEHSVHLMKLILISLYFLPISSLTENNDCQSYIIHMDASSKPAPFSTQASWYISILKSLSMPSDSIDGLPVGHLYTYNHVLNGFSAVICSPQLQSLKQMPGHLAAYPDYHLKLHTTHSPKFLSLERSSGLWPTSRYGDDTIIGIIDSGVWPESKSFNDKGMPPVPARWKGKCETGPDFGSTLCNRKLIGARFFNKGRKQSDAAKDHRGYYSPRDYEGHGTHTLSTAAGSQVAGASYFGYAEGTMTGIAPMARLAAYKVFFDNNATASDVLAAMDQAIEDGVDLMSLSLADSKLHPYYEDALAIGAFAAMEKGIFVSVSAGNGGPKPWTVLNSAPWYTSVGAGTIDRDYIAAISLGDTGMKIKGRSFFPEKIFVSDAPLYFGRGNISRESCSHLSLNQMNLTGKIVFCAASDDNVLDQMSEVSTTNAKGAIFATDIGRLLYPEDFSLPFVAVTLSDGELIKKYLAESPAPTVGITFVMTELGTKPAPQVADFSSRGPSRITPGILKPDILAPGANILASWAPIRGFTPIRDDYLRTDYALVSGTSMSAPHVVGIAALLKSVHKDWSPGAIRSAMMTTADLTDNTGTPINDLTTRAAATPLDYGAGHVNPNKAMDPGLVYDIGLEDYKDFLCGLNYTRAQMVALTRRPEHDCTRANADLNYPSFTVIVKGNSSSQVFTRILTNVGDVPTSYHAVIDEPKSMKVVVKPQVLSFDRKGSKRKFWMKVDVNLNDAAGVNTKLGYNGFLSWIENGGKHVVRSPIVSVSEV